MTIVKVEQEKKRYTLIIKPAVPPGVRYKLGKALEGLGYRVSQRWDLVVDMSECNIIFEE